ncbi:MAG: hypothetical protein K0B05_01160 [Bacteroidales bacterium]|nr:hypothetical protein [Bacteroidales bacterium]
MNRLRLKYIFFAFAALLLIIMVILSRNAGITCDEVLHYNHSVAVYEYFATQGEDRSALETPLTHLKYYGQFYDNFVTFLINWFSIDDIYGFRHLMSSLAGWLTVFVTALLAVWLSGYRTGIIVLLLFAVSPTFMGHAQNNLKDVPFALSYIAGTFFILKVLFPKADRVRFADILFLILSIGFSISIRAGGLLLICYLVLFFFIIAFYNRINEGKIDFGEYGKRLIIIVLVSFSAYFAGILLWPFALESPFRNVITSYRVMAHFPDTFRQIFEGKTEWSDFMPWYYLPKSMAITIPIVVFAGVVIFFACTKRILNSGKVMIWLIILFTIVFPVIFAIVQRSNLYSSWRQFLFVYPAIILISATGFSSLPDCLKKKHSRWVLIALAGLLSIHPLRFMAANPSYYYLYYNQFIGGLKGAYGNYETDYYYVSQTEASEWLINYLSANKTDTAIVKATYSVLWQFRDHPAIKTSYFRYEERSQHDWDYAIVVNRYIPPYQLRNGIWPPGNAIHLIYADAVPVCAVLERRSKNDYYGYEALNSGQTGKAIEYFEKAIRDDDRNEMIFYNFAAALYTDGQSGRADSLLRKGLEVNPGFEPIIMYLGNIAAAEGRNDEAIMFYERVTGINRKYFQAYVALSGLVAENDIRKARSILRECLVLNPQYKPAVEALADTYRQSDPEIAGKYDELARSIK